MIRKFFSLFNIIKIYFIRFFIIKKNIDIKKKFTLIYKYNYWASKNSKSGTGSDLENTKIIREKLNEIIIKYEIKSLLDLPCGDFYWMKEFMKSQNIKYIGGDIVEEMINELNNQYKSQNINFKKLDLINQKLPEADILLCRDCFIHFSNKDILKALENFSKSNIKYFLITHTLNETGKKNEDILTGEYRFVDLFIEPFNLPKNNLINFNDYDKNEKINSKKIVSMWSKSEIINSINNEKTI